MVRWWRWSGLAVVVLALGCSGGGGGGGGGGPAARTPESSLVEPAVFEQGPEPVSSSSGVSTTEHPNLFLNQNEIDAIAQAVLVGEQPISSHLVSVMQGAHSASLPDPDLPNTVYRGTNHLAFRAAFDRDSDIALAAAIAAQFPMFLPPGDRTLLVSNVRDYLVAWARHSLQVSSISQLCTAGECLRFETPLSITVSLVEYVSAYDLVFEDPILSESDHAEIRTWLERMYALVREGTFIWGGGPATGGPNLCHRYSNHATHHIAGMAAVAYILDDPARIAEALEGPELNYNWSTLLRDAIYIQGDPVLGCDVGSGAPTFTGEAYDRYRHFDVAGISNDPNGDPNSWNDANRGYGYSHITVENLAFVADMALHRGRDLYRASAASGEALDLPGHYMAYFKAVFGPGRLIIVPTGYPGEGFYTGEILQNHHNNLFELLSSRYHQDADIIRALEPYDMLSVPRRSFELHFFGRYFDPRRLAWRFHFDDVSEGWELVDASQVSEAGVGEGNLWLDSIGVDPAIRIQGLFLKSQRYVRLVVRMRVTDPDGGSPPGGVSQFSWRTESGQTGTVAFMHLIDGNLRDHSVTLSGFSSWNSAGNRVVELRLDPVSAAGLQVEIDSISLEVN